MLKKFIALTHEILWEVYHKPGSTLRYWYFCSLWYKYILMADEVHTSQG